MALVHTAHVARVVPRRSYASTLDGRQRIRTLAAVVCSLGAILFAAGPAAALTFGGNATAVAGGGTTGHELITGPESTTGPVAASGTCSSASAQAWVSASAGALALQNWCGGTPTVSCVPDSYASGNASYSDDFLVQSSTLPAGTLVDVALCVRAAIRHGILFGCGGSVFEGVTSSASADLYIRQGSNAPLTAAGRYTERWNCFDGHDLAQTGLFAAGGGEVTLSLTQVPVGATVSVSASLSSATGERSFSAHDEGRVELAVVFGYSAPVDVRLVSMATGLELSTSGNCSAAHLNAWLPPPTGTASVDAPQTPARATLLAPTPNPAPGSTTVAFTLRSAEAVELSVCDVRGARVARIAQGWREAGTHRIEWNGRDDGGRRVRPGMYWLKLATSAGTASRSVVLVR